MGACLLAAVLGCTCASAEDKLLQQLDNDFEEALKAERDPGPLREAARLLAGTNRSDRWTQFFDALRLLRRHRSKAAVPLLLKYMVVHTNVGNGHIMLGAYADTLTVLTGKDIADPYQYVSDRKAASRAAVEELVKTWWVPNKDRLSTDLGKMSREQHQVILARLLSRIDPEPRHRPVDQSLDRLASDLRAALRGGPEQGGRPLFFPEDLHPALLPLLLEQAGYRDRPPVRLGERETAQVSLGRVALLGTMRRENDAPNLGAVAVDRRQNTAVRLTCLLALAAAGEDLKTAEVLTILDAEKKVDRRVLAALALEHSGDQRVAVPRLIRLLEDPNRDVRAAAVQALFASRPREALPGLQKLLAAPRPGEPVHLVLFLVARIGTKDAQKVLADFLRSALKEEGKGRYRTHALFAFEQAVGKKWSGPRTSTPEREAEAARQALEWWDRENQAGAKAPAEGR